MKGVMQWGVPDVTACLLAVSALVPHATLLQYREDCAKSFAVLEKH